MKTRNLLPLLIIAFLFLLPSNTYASTTVTWYFRADQHTVNGVTGYVVNETLTATSKNVSISSEGDLTAYWGWRIWLVKSDNSTVELTSGSPVATVSRSADGVGMQSSTWVAPSTSLHIGYDALKLVLYMKLGDGSWEAKATFVSPRLIQKAVAKTTWTFKTCTYRLYSVPDTYAYFLWGSSSVQSQIEGIQFVDLDVYENMNYKLQTGDFVGFILYPYLNLIGNLFYGLVMLMMCVPMYIRYKSWTPILLMFIIFGGTGGIFTLLVPEVGFGITWIFLLFGLAGLLYRVFR